MLSAKPLIDSKRLHVFYQVAKLGSLSRAEAVLFVAQPAISRSLSRLEDDLGVKLLERHGRGVKPTQYGEILLRQAEMILHDMEEAVSQINRAKREPGRRVSISASAIVMSMFMPKILSRMIDRFPDIEVVAIQSPSGEIYNSLVTGQVDIAIVMQVPNKQKFFMKRVFHEPMIMIASKKNEVAKRSVIRREDFPDLPIILPAAPNGMRGIIEDYVKAGDVDLIPHVQVDSVPLIKSMIATHKFCSVMPQTTYDLEFEKNRFVGVPLHPPLTRTLYAAAHKGIVGTEHIRTMLQIIEEVFAEFEADQAQSAA